MGVWLRSSLVPRGGRLGTRGKDSGNLDPGRAGFGELGWGGRKVGERAGARPRGAPPTRLKLG